MIIKKVGGKIIKDSRGEKTILVFIKTQKGTFFTSSPSGKSRGKYELKPYGINLVQDIMYIKKIPYHILQIKNFNDLKNVENYIGKNLGGNSLFALEASLLKALAKENNKDLWKYLLDGKRIKKFPIPVGNAIGGGMHSRGVNGKKPDFQEFLFIPHGKNIKENKKLNEIAYSIAKKIIKSKKRNDEGAWETIGKNEVILQVMKQIRYLIKKIYHKKIDIGIDIAASTFFKKRYVYRNPFGVLTKQKQILYIRKLITNYKLFYIEDPLEENDFSGFRDLLKKVQKNNCLIVGDDLTTTNPDRLKKAIKNKSINAIILKPNQIGSLIAIKKVIDIARKNKIKIIVSHRSGETSDSTIADIAVGFKCDFIKTGIYGKVRESKLRRLIDIENIIKS